MNRQFYIIIKSVIALLSVISLLGGELIVQARALAKGPILSELQSDQAEQPLAAENDAENAELLGHLGGIAQTIAVQGQYAYVGFGPELSILDVSDPANIQRVGWLVAEGEVKDIDVDGNFAYLAFQSENLSPHYWSYAEVGITGLQVVDIRHPSVPVTLAKLPLADCGASPIVVVRGTDLYVALTACTAFGGSIQNAGGYLHRLDISNPSKPIELASFSIPFGEVDGLAADDAHVYALYTDYNSGSRLKVFDVTSPDGLVETGSTEVSPETQGIVISGDYAFLAAGGAGLVVTDISDPNNPATVLTHTIPGEAQIISIQGTDAYLGTDTAQILSVDISDPLNPIDDGSFIAAGHPEDIALQDGSMFTANGWQGFEWILISDPSQISSFQPPEWIRALEVLEPYAYVASEDGLWVMDISDPSLPFPVAHLQTLPAVSIALVGNYAYLACPGDGLRIIDITNPPTPVEAGYFGNPAELTQVVRSGNYLFVAAGPAGLLILDLSNPTAPSQLGSLDPDYSVNALTVSGNYAYLAADNGNLTVIDITDPTNPHEVALYNPPDDALSSPQIATSVQVKDQIAYLGVISPPPTLLAGYYTGEVILIDVSDPETPVEFGGLPTDGYGWAPMQIELDAAHAYVAFERQGLGVYDIANPNATTWIGGYDPSESVAGVALSGDYIFAFNKSAFILHFIDPALPTTSGWITQANHQPFPGALVSNGNPVFDQISDAQGAYSFRGLADGSYTLVPSLSDYVFTPPSRTVNVPPSAWSQNFTILPEPVSLDFTPGISATLMYTDTQGLPTWLDIPADASAAPFTLQAAPTTGEDAPGYAFAGHAFELVAGQNNVLTPSFTFDSPITVTIQYSAEDIAVVSDTGNIILWWWDGAAWQDAAATCSPSPEYVRDTDNFTLSIPICQSGAYQMMGPTHQAYLPLVRVNH